METMENQWKPMATEDTKGNQTKQTENKANLRNTKQSQRKTKQNQRNAKEHHSITGNQATLSISGQTTTTAALRRHEPSFTCHAFPPQANVAAHDCESDFLNISCPNPWLYRLLETLRSECLNSRRAPGHQRVWNVPHTASARRCVPLADSLARKRA